MRQADLEAVLALERCVFSDPWTRGMLAQEMDVAGGAIFVADVFGEQQRQKRVAAYACMRVQCSDMELLRLAVWPVFRRYGVGGRLLGRCMAKAGEMGADRAFLELRQGNRVALSFYSAQGFCVSGARPGYYQDTGETALIMARDLP